MPDTSSPIILPGDPEFDWTLATAFPPDWRAVADRIGDYCTFVASPGSGLLRPATPGELEDYLWGGEYDERMMELDDEDWQQ
ncbi:hypothetical protein P7L53_00480 [Thermoleptolyngbya sichuanensis XZ-Cy5]|uniref:hypothetical protein n=1 Tax=Thermoleptolyngbya sichuanensis TaxID=2885951 RepID=UPI00240DEB38|nr:hypothetical protein [Thermoleptolyngbya sichuanensis]MDG2614707.1 hypothetical protein [Thermoleptolyngbya sichuanensis XZ-Cy5]